MALEKNPNKSLEPAPNTKRLDGFHSPAARRTFMRAYEQAMHELPSPTATHDIATSFGTARLYKFGHGDATPLVLLPGRAASTPMWQPNLAGLAKVRPVYTVDLIGESGMSVQTQPISSPADQAKWIDEAFEHLKIAKIHLVGVSFGGWTAFHQALQRPERIASVTLLDPVSVFARFSWKALVLSIGTIPFLPTAWREKLLSWISGGAEASADDPVARLIASGMKDFKNKLPAPKYPSDDQVRSLQMPVLVLIAGKSIIHNPQKAEARAKRLLRRGQVELWPEASHAITGEFPERVDQTILDFVKAAKQ